MVYSDRPNSPGKGRTVLVIVRDFDDENSLLQTTVLLRTSPDDRKTR